jgi:hypothetical protein
VGTFRGIQRGRRTVGMVVAACCLLSVVTACKDDSQTGAPASTREKVTAQGATVMLAGTTISVPAGGAKVGQTLTLAVAEAAFPSEANRVLPPLSEPVQIDLGGAQPTKPVTVSARVAAPPAAGAVLKLLTRSNTGEWQVLPARYDPAAKALTATTTHFSFFRFVRIDIDPVLSQFKDIFTSAFDISVARPACSGRPLTSDDVTYSLPEKYAGKGDGIVWPCLRDNDGQLSVDLTNASGLPYLVRSAPRAQVDTQGSVDIGKAAILAFYQSYLSNVRFSQSLLLPGEKVAYTFPVGGPLPRIGLEFDGFANAAATLIWAVQFVLDLFHIDVKLLKATDALKCVGDLVNAATEMKFSGRAVGTFAKSVISCFKTVTEQLGGAVGGIAGLVLGALAGGVSIVINDLIGAVRTIGGRDHTQFDVGSDQKLVLDHNHVGDFANGTAGQAVEQSLRALLGKTTETREIPRSCTEIMGDNGYPPERWLTWGGLTVRLVREKGLHLEGWFIVPGPLPPPVQAPYGITTHTTVKQALQKIPKVSATWDDTFTHLSIETPKQPNLYWFSEHEDRSGTIASITNVFHPCE